MKNNSRREFLRDTSLVTSGVLLISPLAATKKYNGTRQAISCAPGSISSLTGTIGSVQSGQWSNPSTWGGRVPEAGDTPIISSGHSIEFDMTSTTVAGVNIASGGTLQFNTSASSELLSSQNIVVEGKLVMKPSSANVVQRIRFIGINENNFTGSGHDVLSNDIGLWVMGAGQLDIYGAKKKAWTRTTGSVGRGASSFSVQDASGWNVGDEIVLVPTEMPGDNLFDFNEALNQPVDRFAPKFERRNIVSISGNSITVNSAFNYDHNQVATDSKTFNPEVANLSRNVRIEGTATGRSHIFIRSSVPQNIYYMAGRYLGPRKGSPRSSLVSGRYGLHFHHCNFGSVGSIVEGCSISETGNRAYVPHTSHGITMRENVAFNCMEASFWWDFQEVTHNTLWDGNLTALVTRNGLDAGCRGMELNMGDGNVARNNVVVYGHSGDEHTLGGYVWNADSEGVWIFENNLSHSNKTGLFVWQNTGNNHTIVGQESYNDYLGVFHGAYINSYTYTNCYFYNSLVRVKATSGNSSGVRFEKTVFDGANAKPFVTEIYPSPVGSGADHNAYRECTFKNYTDVAVLMNTFPVSTEIPRKHVSLIKCNFSGNITKFTNESAFDSKVYVQPASGSCSVISQGGTSAIGAFAPYIYGSGNGLKGDYYNGANFANFAFSRIDSMIMFQGWRYDKGYAPTGVHFLIRGDAYSMRWTGKIEAQYTEAYKFRVEGSGGFRLWVNNVQLINSWTERPDNKDTILSPEIQLTAGQRYDIKLEHMNMDGARACQLFWECPSLGRSIHVPQSQLYSGEVTPPPPPPVIAAPPTANAGADISITLPVSKALLDGTASAPASSIKTYEWTKVSGPDTYGIVAKNTASTEVRDLVQGTYVFKLQVTGSTGIVSTDEVTVKVNPSNDAAPQPLVANAGSDVTITLPTSTTNLDGTASTPKDGISAYEWTKVSGPTPGTIADKSQVATTLKDLAEGIYVFQLKITDKTGKTAIDDVRITVKAPAPVANAGADITLALPINSAVLNGSASTAPAGIRSYEWTKVSGPTTYQIVNMNAISPVVRNLLQGTYVFRLTITDRNGVTATDDVSVTVGNGSTTKTEEPKGPETNNGSKATTQELTITAWPNPSSYRVPTFFEIKSNSDLPIRVTIYNQHGKAVSSWSYVPKNSTIKWNEGIQQGTYFAIVEQGTVKKSLQVIKF